MLNRLRSYCWSRVRLGTSLGLLRGTRGRYALHHCAEAVTALHRHASGWNEHHVFGQGIHTDLRIDLAWDPTLEALEYDCLGSG